MNKNLLFKLVGCVFISFIFGVIISSVIVSTFDFGNNYFDKFDINFNDFVEVSLSFIVIFSVFNFNLLFIFFCYMIFKDICFLWLDLVNRFIR